MTTEQRISRLEESTERIEGCIDRLEDAINGLRHEINSRLNVQLQLNSGMWVTTVLGVIAVLVAVLFKS
jgi:hypothetical protein